MNFIIQFVVAHQFAVYAVSMAIVSCLPEPLPTERWYGFLFKVLHLASINVGQVFPSLKVQRGQQG